MFTEEVQNASEITLKCNQRFGHLKSQKKKNNKKINSQHKYEVEDTLQDFHCEV